MEVGQIAENVFIIGNRIACSNSILIRVKDRLTGAYSPNKVILIDPGTTAYGNLHYLLSKLKAINIEKIDEIWVTHAHPDHTQAIEFIRRATDYTKMALRGHRCRVCEQTKLITTNSHIKVRCHPIAKKILESPHPIIAFLEQQSEGILPLLTRVFKENLYKPKVINKVMRALSRWGVNIITINWRKTKVDYAFKDGETVNGVRVIYLPGHTPEEVGFLLQEEKILITGDLLAYGKSIPIAGVNVPASDIDDALNSLKIIQQIDPKLIIPAHGRIIAEPKSAINQCIKITQKLRDEAHIILRTSRSTLQVLLKWWALHPLGCKIQQRLCMWGILAKSAMLTDGEQ